LKVAGSSCKCTIGSLDSSWLEPGAETGVTLSWKAIGVLNEFNQSATIATNDPVHTEVNLIVHGLVTRTIVFEPENINLNEISTAARVATKIHVFSFAEQPLDIQSVEWTDARTEQFAKLDFRMVPVDTNQFPHHAHATVAAELHLEIEPGLPLGAIGAQVRLRTNLENLSELEVPIQGFVIGDIEVIAGSQYDASNRILTFEKVDRKAGQEIRFHLSVQGEFKDQLELTIGEINPAESLFVKVGQPIERSKRRLFPIICTIPPDAPPVRLPGTNAGNFGRITLETNHPHIPKIVIYTRLTIE
jgi:hypothetical protein